MQENAISFASGSAISRLYTPINYHINPKVHVVGTFRPEGIAGINSGRARLLTGILACAFAKTSEYHYA
jgi:hypothetical protein